MARSKITILSLGIVLVFTLSVLSGCPASGTKDTQESKSQPVKQPETSQDYGRFVELRRNPPVDFAALTDLYRKDLAAYVKQVDQRYATGLDQEATQALEKCRAGLDMPANVQIAEKSVQRAFILSFSGSLELLGDDPGHQTAKEAVLQSMPIIRSMATRRSQWAGKQMQYQDDFDAIMRRIMAAADSYDRKLMTAAQTEAEALLVKLVALSVFYELDGLEKSRGQEAAKSAEKRAEAWMYYRSLNQEHQRRNPEGARTVGEQLIKTPDLVEIDLVQAVLAQDFSREIAGLDPKLLGL